MFKTAPKPQSLLGYHRILSPTAGVRVSPLCLGVQQPELEVEMYLANYAIRCNELRRRLEGGKSRWVEYCLENFAN